jgi:hypothetical protein
MEGTEYIPKEKFNLWYGLFKKSNGRLLNNPVSNSLNKVYVRYEFNDMESYNELCENYNRLTTEIIETKRGFWKRFKTRFIFVLKGSKRTAAL